jgi:hypothetical protein
VVEQGRGRTSRIARRPRAAFDDSDGLLDVSRQIKKLNIDYFMCIKHRLGTHQENFKYMMKGLLWHRAMRAPRWRFGILPIL